MARTAWYARPGAPGGLPTGANFCTERKRAESSARHRADLPVLGVAALFTAATCMQPSSARWIPVILVLEASIRLPAGPLAQAQELKLRTRCAPRLRIGTPGGFGLRKYYSTSI